MVNSSGKIVLAEPAILVTDLEIKEPQELLPLLDMACRAGIRNLVLLAAKISERALAVLLLPANRQRIHVVAVKAPVNTVLREDLEDMAVLVGGRPLQEKAGDNLEAV